MSLEYNQKAVIKVFGIGGAGCNAVNRMYEENIQGAEFYVCNTDIQVLDASKVENKVILGQSITKGLGAGANPEVGKKAALENQDEIKKLMDGADMIFIAAGMGGGTGTGAAPVFAKIAKEVGALTVGIVTKPFDFEGKKRLTQSIIGLEQLKEYVDSLIIVSNNQLLNVIGNIPFKEAFREADNVLRQGVQTIVDLIAVPYLINLDFADIRSVMEGQGSSLIGIGMANGDNRAVEAAQKAIQCPLLEAQISGAKNAIINVTGGNDISIFESSQAVDLIRAAAGEDIDIIYGIAINENIGDSVIVTVIATGFDLPNEKQPQIKPTRFNTNETSVESKEEEPKIEEVIVEEDNKIPDFFKNR